MKEIVNAAQAAKIIGCEPAVVRFYMQKGIWNFGRVVTKKEAGGKQNRYIISVRTLCSYFDIPLEEAEKRLNNSENTK